MREEPVRPLAPSHTPPASLLRSYAVVTALELAVVAALVGITWESPSPVAPAAAIVAPVVALVALTFVVITAMALVRNVSVVRGTASMQYYRDYRDGAPDERIERPARTFNNLMQLPTLFYVVCAFMIATAHVDRAGVRLAWLFVGTRAVHALIFIMWNSVPYRFAAYLAGVITLGVLWTRFAEQALAGGW